MKPSKWGNQDRNPGPETEMLLELLEGTMQEEGYGAVPLGEIKNKFTTSDGAIRAFRDGKEFLISVDEIKGD